ncbi:transposase [Actinopolymorpha pittospori]|uniref:transposase n=1 Tax=Actinopolymorpha pittospori TaxID=648752 RepID=UPI003CD0C24B
MPGCGVLTAAKIVGETAGVRRFRSKEAYARHNGTAPLPVWSSNRARHRLLAHRQPPTQRRAPPRRAHPSALASRHESHDR